MDKNIISIETLKNELKNTGDVISLKFGDKSFNVLVRKPDLMCMIVDEKIPNPLLKSVENMTKNGKMNLTSNDEKTDYEKVGKWIEFLRKIAKETLISPTYSEFEQAEIVLDLQNLMAIYSYVTEEVNNLESFRNV